MFNRIAYTLLLLVLLHTGVLVQKAQAQYENSYVSYNEFYNELASWGQWIDDPRYGYVWLPNVDGSFRPYYTNGYWAMTDYGNTWVSEYPWGWACFHYGRWTYDAYYGWLWIPGNYWGPAWVCWRVAEGYYGWAPMGPGYDFNHGDYACPNDWWVFIPPQYLYTGNYYRYWYGPRGNSHILAGSQFINNTFVNNNVTFAAGPRAKEVQAVTNQPVTLFHLKNSVNNRTSRVHNNEIKMFRPAEIKPSTLNGQRVSPPNVVAAPQAIRAAQPVNNGQATPPQFHNDVPVNNARPETPGTNINQVAEPQRPTPRYDNNPYEWDVNKALPQPKREPQAAPQGEQPAPQPRPMPQQRPAPAPQSRPNPWPQQQPAPEPQQQPAPNRSNSRK